MFNFEAFDGFYAGFIWSCKGSPDTATDKEFDYDYFCTAMVSALVGALRNELATIQTLDNIRHENDPSVSFELMQNYIKYNEAHTSDINRAWGLSTEHLF